MSEYNYVRRLGTTIKDPTVLFTAARVNGRAIGAGDFPMGDFDVDEAAIDYMIGNIMGRVWWTAENLGASVEVDLTIVETGETKTIIRDHDNHWKEATDAEPRTD